MKVIGGFRYHILCGHLAGLLVLALFLAVAAQADSQAPPSKGWELERDVDEPSYALIEPTVSNLNIDVLVLTCAVARTTSILQLDLYLSTERSLTPKGVDPGRLKPDPRVMITIDGRSFQMTLFFADDHVLMANTVTDRMPSVSRSLVDAIQSGRDMTIRFDLLSKSPGQPAFDGEATHSIFRQIKGGAAVEAVRQCIVPGADQLSKAGADERPVSSGAIKSLLVLASGVRRN